MKTYDVRFGNVPYASTVLAKGMKAAALKFIKKEGVIEYEEYGPLFYVEVRDNITKKCKNYVIERQIKITLKCTERVYELYEILHG